MYAIRSYYDAGEIWMGTAYYSRMACLKPKANTWDVLTKYIPIERGMILNIYQDVNGAVWLGSYNGGLYRAIKQDVGYRVDQFDMSNSSYNFV